jgi:hypothetical protein
MQVLRGKLTERRAAIMRDQQPGPRYSDGGALYLECNRGGRSWMFRYQGNRREHRLGLGSSSTVSCRRRRSRR